MEKMQELLVAGVKFPDLGIEKIEVDYLVSSLYNLVARLDEQRPNY